MKYILDTDMLIYFLKGHTQVVEHIAAHTENALATTIINQTELLYGAFSSEKKEQNLKKIRGFLAEIEVLDFSDKAAYVFAEQKAILKKHGTLIADMDLMIASIALANERTLVTNNTKHFEKIKKLPLENWSL